MHKKSSGHIAAMGICLSLTAALSFADSVISSGFALPGVRIGLANIVITAVLLKYGIPSACFLSLLRSVFVITTRGITAGILSLSGGIMSLTAAAVLIYCLGSSCKFACIVSALLHTLGQLAAAWAITGSIYILCYAPLLAPVSIASGFLTGAVTASLMEKFFSAGFISRNFRKIFR